MQCLKATLQSEDTCAEKFLLILMGGWANPQACAGVHTKYIYQSDQGGIHGELRPPLVWAKISCPQLHPNCSLFTFIKWSKNFDEFPPFSKRIFSSEAIQFCWKNYNKYHTLQPIAGARLPSSLNYAKTRFIYHDGTLAQPIQVDFGLMFGICFKIYFGLPGKRSGQYWSV